MNVGACESTGKLRVLAVRAEYLIVFDADNRRQTPVLVCEVE